ncbi:hypothetical protein [Mucilaginibacter antarcticus]
MALIDGPAFTKNSWLVVGGIILLTFVLFFYLPFLYWSKRTTAWKLWAFDHVDDVHELKIVALQAHLFPLYGSAMDQLQIQSTKEREQWAKLQERFQFRGNFIDDSSIPAETNIYFSKLELSLNILLGLFISSIGITALYLSSIKASTIWVKLIGFAFALAPWYMIIATFKNLLNRKPQLTLNKTGLYTWDNGLVPWDVIYDIEVTATQRRNFIKYTLHFKYPGGIVNKEITELDTNRNKLERLIRVYRGRLNSGS